MTGIFSRVSAAAAWIAEISSCHFEGDSARSLTLSRAPTPYSTIAFRSLPGLMRSAASCPSVTMPISSCVICPTFSFSVMRPSRSRIRWTSAGGSAGSGTSCCSRNDWLSTMEEDAGACEPALHRSASTQAAARTRARITWCRAGLENQLQAELRLSRIAGLRRLAEVAGQRVPGNLRRRAGIARVVGHRHGIHRRVQTLRQEVRPVEHVEDLETQL